MQINHLPILWLPCAGMGLRVRRAKFRRVGHRFNRESCVGATVSCSKRLCHLVNCCAGSKGVLWLNRGWNKRALKECGRRRTHGTVQHMLLRHFWDSESSACCCTIPKLREPLYGPIFPHKILLLEAVGTALVKSVSFSPLRWSA